MNNNIAEFVKFLDNSPSCYHATANLELQIKAAGYERLHEHEDWTLVPGGKYYMVRGGTTLIAFRIPRGEAIGFMMSASHVDRPTFKVKGEAAVFCRKSHIVYVNRHYGTIFVSDFLHLVKHLMVNKI